MTRLFDENGVLVFEGSIEDGGSGAVFVASVPLSSAQLLALFSSPVTVVAAPAAGSYVLPISAVISVTPGGTAYAGNDSLWLGTAGLFAQVGTWMHVLPTGGGFTTSLFHEAATPAAAPFLPEGSENYDAASIDGAALLLSQQNADMTLGNGTARLDVFYAIRSLT